MNTATHRAPASCLKASIRATALVALSLLGSTAAMADPQVDSAPVTHSTKVSLTDLDLSTPEGVSAARERLRQSARRLCNQVADELDLSRQANFVACVDASMASALRSLTEPGAAKMPAVAARTPAATPISK
jgi:UrcA family protein